MLLQQQKKELIQLKHQLLSKSQQTLAGPMMNQLRKASGTALSSVFVKFSKDKAGEKTNE